MLKEYRGFARPEKDWVLKTVKDGIESAEIVEIMYGPFNCYFHEVFSKKEDCENTYIGNKDADDFIEYYYLQDFMPKQIENGVKLYSVNDERFLVFLKEVSHF